MRLLIATCLIAIVACLAGCCHSHASYGISYGEPSYCAPAPPCGVVVSHGHCHW